MSFSRIGDWEKVGRLISNLKEEMENAQVISLKRWSLKAEAIAKKHISSQDLGWKPLKAATIEVKVKKGHSENILVQTSTYFQSITSWVDVSEKVAYAGVKKTAKSKDGDNLADIAATHEFGSKTGNIPERPLWRPTFAETMRWFATSNSRPSMILKENLKKYGV